MITDTDFATQLKQAYRRPAAGLDAGALERAVDAALVRADRRRRLVLAGGAALGTSVAALGLLALGLAYPLGSIGHEVGLLLAAVRDALASLRGPWTFALVGLVLAASAAARANEDS